MALEVSRAVAEKAGQHLDVVLEAAHQVIEGKAEGVEFGLVPAGADAEDEPPARGRLQRPCLAGELGRRPEGGTENEGAEFDPPGAGRNVAQEGERLRPTEEALPSAVQEEVIHDPDGVIAEAFRGHGVSHHLLEGARTTRGELVGGDRDADLHALPPNVAASAGSRH